MIQKKLKPSKLFVLISLGLFSIDASAIDKHWDAMTGNWNVPTNWLPNGSPTASDDAYIANNGTANITDARVANVLFVGLNVGQNGTLNITGPNGALNLSSSLNIGYETAGTVTVDGLGSTITSAGTISVGTNAGGIGTLTASNDALISAPNAVVIGQGAVGSSGNLSLNSNATLSTLLVFFNTGGSVNFNGGILKATSSQTGFIGGSGPSSLNINTGGATIDSNGFNIGTALGFTGVGGLTKKGSGILTLTGTNTYDGVTTISGGTLQLGNGGATGSVAGNIVNNAALIFNRSNPAYTYGGVISGTGTLTKLGSGSTLVLNGTNTFMGDTTITAGILLLGDDTHTTAAVGGNVNVEMGAQLSGFGTVGGNLDNNGGIVSPGNSIGTITVNLDYTQSVGGSYIVQVDQAGNSDLLNILGTANLNGIVGISAINNGFFRGYPYTILMASNDINGTFSNTNIDGVFNQGLLQGQVRYVPGLVQFIVDYNPVLFNEFAANPNQKAVADYILETGGTPAVQALMASITTEAGFQSAMDQISGATYANNDLMITRVGNWFSGEMADRFDAFPSCNCHASLLPANRRCCDQKNAFWAAGHGAEENISSGQVSGLNTDTGNFALGYEWAVCSTGKVGVGAGYSTFSSRAQTREMANTTGNLYQVGVYGRRQMGNWLFGAAFDAGVTSDMDTDRRIEGALAVVTTKGSSKAHLYSEQVRLGYDVTSNRPMRLSPFVGVIGQQLNRNSFTETTQTGFELNVDGSTYRSTRSQLGVMLELPTNSAFKPFASLDWEHEFSDVNSTFNANLVGLEGKFHVQGQSIGRNSALLKAGTVIACGKNWNVSALYQGWYGSGWQENGGTLQANVAFG